MKLSDMSDSFLSNVRLSLYWSQAFLDRDFHSDVAFTCVKHVSGNAWSSLIGCWDWLRAVTDRVRRGGLQGWVGSYQVSNNRRRVVRGFTWGVMGLDRVWYQAVDTWCHKAWIRFGSGWWVVGFDKMIVGFVVTWARAVCDRFWVSAVIYFRCLLLFYVVFVFFFAPDWCWGLIPHQAVNIYPNCWHSHVPHASQAVCPPCLLQAWCPLTRNLWLQHGVHLLLFPLTW